MILAKGKLCDSTDQARILDHLEAEINTTRISKTLSIQRVISAMDRLGQMISDGAFKEDLLQLSGARMGKYIETLIMSFKRESLEFRMKTELGQPLFEPQGIVPPLGQEGLSACLMPLGTLLHIAAGNVDGLPVFSVAEGLLTGNVNILKLPESDEGLSMQILRMLMEIEPEISDFVYVFDTPSSDLPALKKMAECADGIVVWGSDAAVSAVRKLAPSGCRLIEWGHKLGFAYISGFEDKEAELAALAEHLLSTRQLLCSSCQTIFVDTDNLEELHAYCKEFLPYMEAAALRYPVEAIDVLAERTLIRYNQKLEDIIEGRTKQNDAIYQGKYCSLKIYPDQKLELSDMFGNCIVKGLPRHELFSALRKAKGHLQTAGLICPEEHRKELSDLLARSGVARIMRVKDMSSAFCGEAHDGEYALKRYTRIVNVQ